MLSANIKILFTFFSMVLATGNYNQTDSKIQVEDSLKKVSVSSHQTKTQNKVKKPSFKKNVRKDAKKSAQVEMIECVDKAEPGCGSEVLQVEYNEAVKKPNSLEKKFLSDLGDMSEDNLFNYLEGSKREIAHKKSASHKNHL